MNTSDLKKEIKPLTILNRDEAGIFLLRLMFREGESICVSPNKFGYHSVYLEDIICGERVTLVPTPESADKRGITWEDSFEDHRSEEMTLVSLNPIKGFRLDSNCTAYRNFLVEMDYGSLDRQLEYIKKIKLPYSAVVFSGNKSLHFLISLDQDLPSETSYRTISEWILSIATAADQNTKNPSRSIRIPGALRENGQYQELLEYRGAVKLSDLSLWLSGFPEAKPARRDQIKAPMPSDSQRIPTWMKKQLEDGIDFKNGRNKTWFSIACAFANAGFAIEDAIEFLDAYFTPERDFAKKEWLSAIKSAFKYISKK